VFARGAHNTVLENVTLFRNAQGGGAAFSADDEEEALPCSAIAGGCSFTLRNTLVLDSRGAGVNREAGSVGDHWLVEHSNVYGSAGKNFPGSEAIGDGAGNVQHTLSVGLTGGRVGRGVGECLAWIPDDSTMKGAGKDGADIGADVRYRYVDGALTTTPLWDPATGAFPCGVQVAGVNDRAGDSCFDVHRRFNVQTNGCSLPD
jgi:hypothetical protein